MAGCEPPAHDASAPDMLPGGAPAIYANAAERLLADAALGLSPEQWRADSELRQRFERYQRRCRNAGAMACRLLPPGESNFASICEVLATCCYQEVCAVSGQPFA